MIMFCKHLQSCLEFSENATLLYFNYVYFHFMSYDSLTLNQQDNTIINDSYTHHGTLHMMTCI